MAQISGCSLLLPLSGRLGQFHPGAQHTVKLEAAWLPVATTARQLAEAYLRPSETPAFIAVSPPSSVLLANQQTRLIDQSFLAYLNLSGTGVEFTVACRG